jgi:hypothetical protein
MALGSCGAVLHPPPHPSTHLDGPDGIGLEFTLETPERMREFRIDPAPHVIDADGNIRSGRDPLRRRTTAHRPPRRPDPAAAARRNKHRPRPPARRRPRRRRCLLPRPARLPRAQGRPRVRNGRPSRRRPLVSSAAASRGPGNAGLDVHAVSVDRAGTGSLGHARHALGWPSDKRRHCECLPRRGRGAGL